MFVGQFDLGTGTNSFTNAEGAIFVPGPQLLLGDPANLLTQSGTMYQGDRMTQTGFLTGSFKQTETGKTFAELDFGSADPNVDGGNIDQLFATGTVDLAGRFDVSLLTPQLVPYGRFQKTLFNGALGATDSGMELTAAPSVVITYDLLYPTGNAAVLEYRVDFAPKELGRNLRGLGQYFNRIQAAGSSPELADVIVKLLYDPDLPTYRESLSQMSPDIYGELQAHAIEGNERLGQLLLGRGGYRTQIGKNRFWFQVLNEETERDAEDDYKAIDLTDTGVALGFESLLSDNWRLGLGFSYWDTDANGYDGRWTADGNAVQAGVALRGNAGQAEFGAALLYGRTNADVTRRGSVVNSFESFANQELNLLSAIIGGAYRFDLSRAYIKLSADLGATQLMNASTDESGADALNLKLQDYSETHTWGRPAAEFGYRSESFGAGLHVHAFGGVGFLHYFSDPYTDVFAGLEGAPSGVPAMQVSVPLSQNEVRTFVGLELKSTSKWALGLRYSKAFSDRTDIDAWTLNFTLDW